MTRYLPPRSALVLLLCPACAPAQVKPRADTSNSAAENCATTSQPAKTPWTGGDSVLCDLDGDGAIDHVRVSFNPDGWSFQVHVNQVRSAGSGASLDETFAIVDIDTLDGMREIAVTENTGNPDHVTHFYAWDGIDVFSMGSIPGSDGIVVDGSGIIRARVRGQILQSWSYTGHYRLGKNHKIERAPVDLYPMNTRVVLKKPLQLVRSRLNPAAAVRLAPGDTADIVSSDDLRWCLVRNRRGQSGWFFVDPNGNVNGNAGSPTEIFDGLVLED
jgi:hypothetical protein